MIATYSPRLISMLDAGDRVDDLVAHDVGLPEIVGADDDAFALEPLAFSTVSSTTACAIRL
jgi:hypothetical protein